MTQADPMKSIYLHIGTHKTGSTSLQRWLVEHEAFLRDNGYGLYTGQPAKQNHMELYLAAMRYDRDSFGKQSLPAVTFDEDYTTSVADRVQSFLDRSAQEKVILTTEGLSLLRHEDELHRLKEILGGASARVTVILFLRSKGEFLNSYRRQLEKKKGRTPSRDYWSALYVADDTWLTDYEGLVSAYAAAFGSENIKVIDYDREVQHRANIIPAFLEAVGIASRDEHLQEFDSYFDNPTSRAGRAPGWERMAHRLSRRLHAAWQWIAAD